MLWLLLLLLLLRPRLYEVRDVVGGFVREEGREAARSRVLGVGVLAEVERDVGGDVFEVDSERTHRVSKLKRHLGVRFHERASACLSFPSTTVSRMHNFVERRARDHSVCDVRAYRFLASRFFAFSCGSLGARDKPLSRAAPKGVNAATVEPRASLASVVERP